MSVMPFEKVLDPPSYDKPVVAGERFRFHSNPKDEGGGRPSNDADADNTKASPLDLHRAQEGMDLGSHFSSQASLSGWLPSPDDMELLHLVVHLRVSRHLVG